MDPEIIDDAQLTAEQRAVLIAYPIHRTLTATADALGIHRQRVWEWGRDNSAFKDALGRAKEQVGDEVEGEMLRRAIAGKSQMSDTLLIFATKRFKPEYRDSYNVNVRQESITLSMDLSDLPPADKALMLQRLATKALHAGSPDPGRTAGDA